MIAKTTNDWFAIRLAFALEIVDGELQDAVDWDSAVNRIRDSLHELFETHADYERFAATNAFRAIAQMLWDARKQAEKNLLEISTQNSAENLVIRINDR